MKRRAFTLIELLVVVAIIASLIAILLPSMNSAREKAKIVKCLANLRSVGQALYLYGNDFNHAPPFLPGTYGWSEGGHYDVYRPPGSGGIGWTGLGLLQADNTAPNDGPWDDYARAPYLGTLDILQCPSNTAPLFDYELQRAANGALRVPYVYRNPLKMLTGIDGGGPTIVPVKPDPGKNFNTIFGSGLGAVADNATGTDPALSAGQGVNPRSHEGYNVLMWAGDAAFHPDKQQQLLYGWGTDFNRLWSDLRL